jgi:hypothetical protein
MMMGDDGWVMSDDVGVDGEMVWRLMMVSG